MKYFKVNNIKSSYEHYINRLKVLHGGELYDYLSIEEFTDKTKNKGVQVYDTIYKQG